jgi:hypothetical protein
MQILIKGQLNELVLNINNNSRQTFSDYTLRFTHVVSQEVKSYIIDTSNPSQYAENIRYCEIVLDLKEDDLNYEGQYLLEIFGDGNSLVFTSMVSLEGNSEPVPFIEYESDDENNSNYIYIQD